MFLLGTLLSLSNIVFAQQQDSLSSCRIIHRIGADVRPGYIFQTNSFYKGENEINKSFKNTLSTHLKYSFQFHPNTCASQIFGGAYQGIGLAYYKLDNRTVSEDYTWYYTSKPKELGNPITFYIFQGAQIKQFNSRLSLNYEWNFGISFGWKPYDVNNNRYNKAIGSKANAYINADLYLSWILSRQFDLNTGVALTHFSNGNTKFPNAGLNAIALYLGLVYNFNRDNCLPQSSIYVPEFPKHISYDLTLFGSWRRKGVVFLDDHIASPHAYTVLGFNFAPMYNLGYKSRVGISLDGVYDGSANVYVEDYIRPLSRSSNENDHFATPSISNQLALGISGRAEYVMPYFTIGVGLGINVLHGGGDLKSFYQMVTLKTEITRSSYLHIGYSLQDFHDPNFLMLGVGYRFNNKRPAHHR